MSARAPERILKSIVDGNNTGNLEAFMTLCEPAAALALHAGTAAQGVAGVRQSPGSFTARQGFALDNPGAHSDARLVSGIVDELKGLAETPGVSFYVHVKEDKEERTPVIMGENVSVPPNVVDRLLLLAIKAGVTIYVTQRLNANP